MQPLRIHLLGRVRIFNTETVEPVRVTHNVLALLAYPMLHRQRRHSREVLARLFWGDHPQDRARGSMNTTTDRSDSAGQAGEKRYRHLFKHVPICIFVVDLSGTPPSIVEANRRAELVYGYTAAELVGMSATQLVPEDDGPAVMTIVQQVQRGQTVTAETTNQRRDGTRLPVRIIAAPDPTDAGHMIVTVEDITAERQRRCEAEAIDAERRRIAHEIHDGVAQSLAGLRFKSALWSHR